MNRIFILWICGWFCLINLYAQMLPAPITQQYYFQTYDIKNGLSHNTVNTIIQDRLGFMWFGTKDGLNRFDGVTFRIYNKENSKLENNYITKLFEDKEGNLWIGTDAGLYVYNPVMDTFLSIKEYSHSRYTITHAITEIKEDNQHNIWFSVDYEGLYLFNIRTHQLTHPVKNTRSGFLSANIAAFRFEGTTCWIDLYNDNLYYSTDKFKTFHPYKDKKSSISFQKNVINQMVTKGSSLYLCTAKGLFEFNHKTGNYRQLLNCYVRTVAFKSDTELWAGTEQGLYIYNLKTHTFNHIVASNEYDPYALTDNAIYTIYRDKEGGMWIGSYFGGVNYYPYPWSYFEKFYPRDHFHFLGRRVREFCSSNDGTIWIGTEDKGLFNFNPRTKKIVPFSNPKIYSNVHGLCRDNNYLWIGTFSGGLNRLDLRTRQVKNYRQGTASNTLLSNDVFSICKTKSGQLWIGTISGLLRYNPRTDDFTRIPEFTNIFIYNIMETKEGDLWLATYANGAYRYDKRSKTWKHYTNNPKDASSLPYNKVISIFEDSHRRLWFMTQGGGFSQYNPKKDNFIRYDMSDGFPSNIIYKMVEDNRSNLWISTNKGLVCFNPDTNYRKIYTTSDGLLSDQFNYQSGFKDDAGNIYMGCINGFIGFNPAKFRENSESAPIYLTDLFIFNQRVSAGTKGSPLKKSLLYSDRITLSATENSFSLQTAGLSFQSSEKEYLKYKLEGFDKDWHTINGGDMIYYSNLPYRTYTLKVKGINNDGKWNGRERTLQICIEPPFYLSTWAYIIYTLLLLSGAGYGIYSLHRRVQERHKRAMQQFEQEKERELYNAKISFFTNITHEIRTPLTLIKAPLEAIMAAPQPLPETVRENLNIMEMNTNRLLTLVNQLLDFRKTEQRGLKLNFVTTDISQLLQKLCAAYTGILKQHSIRFTNDTGHSIPAAVDIEAFSKIISNLLTNAVKHARSYIKLKADTDDGKLVISVANDGDIIPLSMREKIFRPFIQNNSSDAMSGTGLGLTLARSLAELHHGTLKMDDSETENRFILTLPLKQKDEINVQTSTIKDVQETNTEQSPINQRQEYTLLVVEDNQEMQQFIVNTLAPYYTLLTAGDGEEAIKVLKEHTVNLIISDVMMPNRDGISLCHWVKTTFDYSHIPVILLTAKTALSSKIEGTRSGADAYIEKPFSIEYLKAQVANLLSNREKLRRIFTHSPFIRTSSPAISKPDLEFMQTTHKVVMDNLQNAGFSPDDLAEALNMSRSSLNRKFKGLMDMTPNDYIQAERLKCAARMLKDGETHITEVCHKCGFNTPSYFTKCFKKQFGVLPKDFINKDKR